MRKYWILFLALILLAVIGFVVFRGYQSYSNGTLSPEPASNSVENSEGLSSKADASIEELYAKWQEDKDAATRQAQEKGLEIQNGKVFVTIKVEKETDASNVIDVINNELGGVTDVTYKTIIDAWIPVEELVKLYSFPEVVLIQNPSLPVRL